MPFHWFYIVGLLVIVLIIFGPGRLPELGGAVGKAMREFRKAHHGDHQRDDIGRPGAGADTHHAATARTACLSGELKLRGLAVRGHPSQDLSLSWPF